MWGDVRGGGKELGDVEKREKCNQDISCKKRKLLSIKEEKS